MTLTIPIKCFFLTIFGLVMILTFDIMTSKCNHLTFVPDYSEAVNLVEFPRQFARDHVHILSVYDHRYMYSLKTECLRQLINGKEITITHCNKKSGRVVMHDM